MNVELYEFVNCVVLDSLMFGVFGLLIKGMYCLYTIYCGKYLCGLVIVRVNMEKKCC